MLDWFKNLSEGWQIAIVSVVGVPVGIFVIKSVYRFLKPRLPFIRKLIKKYSGRRKEKIAEKKWQKTKLQYESIKDNDGRTFYSYTGTRKQKHYACGYCLDTVKRLSKLNLDSEVNSGSGLHVYETLSCQKCKCFYMLTRPVRPASPP